MSEENKEVVPEKSIQEFITSNSKVYNLADWGNKLPIYDHAKKKHVEFTFKSWDMEMEEKFSEIQQKAKNVGEFIRHMMMNIIETFDGAEFATMKAESQILTLANLRFADMMYLYIYLRYEELGKDLVLDFHCPACKKLIEKFCGDLSTLEVHVKEESHSQTFLYHLKSPVIMPDGEVIEAIEFKVAGWAGIEGIPGDNAKNQAVVKTTLMSDAFSAGYKNGEKITKHVDKKVLIKKLKKFDIEKIGSLTAVNNGGPAMAIGGKCPHCSTNFVKPLEWTYEVFFDSSSL